MAEQTILFCPFCRESFEGERVCPEHDLKLVPFERLQRGHDDWDEEDAAQPPDDDSPLASFEPGYGRGLVAFGALANLLALPLEFVRGVGDSAGLRTYELARSLPSLWTLLLVTFTLLFVLRRRRSPRALRGMRVLVPALAVVSPAVTALAFHRLHQGTAVWVSGGRTIGLSPGLAVYVLAIASLLTLVGGLKLGVTRAPEQATKRAGS